MTRALKIYASHPPKGSSMKFRNMHCWRVLKGQHKWRVFLEKEKSQPEDAAQDPKRPMGKKKAKAMQSKKRRLEEDGDEEERVAPEVTLLREQIELDCSRFDFERSRFDLDHARFDLDRARFESMNTADDISIMDRDISTYTGARLQFFKHLQEKVMKKYFDEE